MESALDTFRAQREAADQVHARLTEVAHLLERLTRQVDAIAANADLRAVLLAGSGESRVSGTQHVPVSSIGGFYAFKRGSLEFRHLEGEVLRCTGCAIEHFFGMYAEDHFDVGLD